MPIMSDRLPIITDSSLHFIGVVVVSLIRFKVNLHLSLTPICDFESSMGRSRFECDNVERNHDQSSLARWQRGYPFSGVPRSPLSAGQKRI